MSEPFAEEPTPAAALQYVLGQTHLLGAKGQADYAAALEAFQRAAVLGHPGAYTSLATMCAQGLGVPKDLSLALQHLRDGSRLGDVEAIFRLGVFYCAGIATDADVSQGLRLIERAAALDYGDAQCALGEFLMTGAMGLAADPERACDYYERAAEQGNADAMAALGRAYATGRGRPRDSALAEEWLREARDAGATVSDWTAPERTSKANDEPRTEGDAARRSYHLGITHARAGRYADAIPLLAEALDASLSASDFVDCAALLSHAYAALGQTDDAVAAAEAAVRRAGESSDPDLSDQRRRRFMLPLLNKEWSSELERLVEAEAGDAAVRRYIDEKAALISSLPGRHLPLFFFNVGAVHHNAGRPTDAARAWGHAKEAETPVDESSDRWSTYQDVRAAAAVQYDANVLHAAVRGVREGKSDTATSRSPSERTRVAGGSVSGAGAPNVFERSRLWAVGAASAAVLVVLILLVSWNRTSTQGSPAAMSPDARTSSGWAVDALGIGPIRVGMSTAEAFAANGGTLTPDRDTTGSPCFFLTAPSALPGVALMVEEGHVVRVDVNSGSVSTSVGARIGDLQERVASLYGSWLQVEADPSGGNWLIANTQETGERSPAIIFLTDGRRVLSYRAGRRPPVEYSEGCE